MHTWTIPLLALLVAACGSGAPLADDDDASAGAEDDDSTADDDDTSPVDDDDETMCDGLIPEDFGCDPEIDPDEVCDGDGWQSYGYPEELCPSFFDDLDFSEPPWAALPNSGSVAWAGTEPATPTTYWEARARYWDEEGARVSHRSGTLCAEATDPAACEAAFAAIPEPLGWSLGPWSDTRHWIVWNRGDEVGVVPDAAAFQAFLGAVDSRNVALLRVALAGWTWGVELADSPAWLGDGAVRPRADGGWDVVAKKVIWWGPIRWDRGLFRVESDGTTTLVRQSIISISCDTSYG